jgi:hypothetical protein
VSLDFTEFASSAVTSVKQTWKPSSPSCFATASASGFLEAVWMTHAFFVAITHSCRFEEHIGNDVAREG